MYESRHQPLLSIAAFVQRLLAHAATALGLMVGSLVLGMVGYVRLEHMTWLDAFLNVAMLLGGMGPVNPPQTDGGKLFAGLYALYAGLVFVVIIALVFTPVLHRVMHRLHWEGEDEES